MSFGIWGYNFHGIFSFGILYFFLANQLNGHLPMTIYANVLRNAYGDVINGILMAYYITITK
jgi:hypothetical protein